MSDSLYRFISFDSFINLLVSQKTRYINPLLWEDSYESVVYRQMMDKQLNRKVISYFYHEWKDPRKVVNLYAKLWYERTCSFAKCLTKTEENDTMWRIYRYNDKSVRIEVTYDGLKECIDQYQDYLLVLQDIVYDQKDCKPREQAILHTMSVGNEGICNFCHKQELFMHENEKRVLILDQSRRKEFEQILNRCDLCECLDSCSEEEIVERIAFCVENIMEFRREKEEVFVHINPKRYIKSVLVNPFADEQFTEIVKTMCLNFGIQCFKGKSTIYELDF